MILIRRKDGAVQVIPQGAVRMAEYLPLLGVLRIHFLGEEPFLEVKMGEKKSVFYLELLASGQTVRMEEE